MSLRWSTQVPVATGAALRRQRAALKISYQGTKRLYGFETLQAM